MAALVRSVLRQLCAVLTLGAAIFGQTAQLSFHPIDAKYSSALDRIVMISAGPSLVHIYNAATGTDTTVPLSKPPTSLAVSPNGLFAAVAHDRLISCVNLSSASVEKTFVVPALSYLQDVLLSSNYAYELPYTSVQLSTGVVTTNPTNFGARGNTMGVLHPGGNVIYSLVSSTSGLYSWDLSAGGLGFQNAVPSGQGVCAPIWLSPDGSHLYDGCGNVRLAPADAMHDIGPPVPLALSPPVSNNSSPFLSVSESAAAGLLALIPGGSLPDTEVRLVETAQYQQVARVQLPGLSLNGKTYNYHARFAFIGNQGTALYIIRQTDPALNLLNDSSIQTLPLAASSSCAVSLGTNVVSYSASGLIAPLSFTSSGDCFYKAVSSAPWVQVLSGGYGSGSGTLQLHIRGNTGAARAANLTIGNQNLVVVQDAAKGTAPSPQRLSYIVADAGYSKAFNRIVFASSTPNELHLYDPVTLDDRFVTLPSAPASISVQPDGLYAATSHLGSISYINLTTMTIERTVPLPVNLASLVLGGNGFAYGTAITANTLNLYSVNLSTKVSTPLNVGYANSPGLLRLHPSGNFLYANSAPYGSNSPLKFDISHGIAQAVILPPLTGFCQGSFWITEDGRRIVDSCGGVYRSSDSPAEDLQLTGHFAPQSIAFAAESASRQMTAVIPGGFGNISNQNEVQLYRDSDLSLIGRVGFTGYSNVQGAFAATGKYIFWNTGGNQVYAVTQVDPAVLISGFAVETIPADSFTQCAVSISPASAVVPGSASTGTLTVTTGPGCVWSVNSGSVSWARFSDTGGVGSGTVTYSYESAYDTTVRTALFMIGNQQFSLTQNPLPTSIVVSPTQLTFGPSSNSGSVLISAQAGTPWFVTSGADWIRVFAGSQTGSGTLTFSLSANTGPTRTGTLNVLGQAVTITQLKATPPLRFVPVPPCRVVDTRGPADLAPPFNGPTMPGNTSRDFPIAAGRCGLPLDAGAYSFNVTVVPKTQLGYLTIWPTGQAQPFVSTLNSFDGRVKANAAIVPAGVDGSVSVYVTDATDVVLDINGYFTSTTTAGGLSYTSNSCRILDTRGSTSNTTPAQTWLAAGETRTIPPCQSYFPNAKAYVVNVTALPLGSLGYLTLWPAGAPQPFVSTLNSPTGTPVSNLAIVPAGVNGSINLFTTNATDVIVDIIGYFSSNNGYRFYPMTPCRISDTRYAAGPYGGPAMMALQTRSYTVPASGCPIPTDAIAYSLNATAVPASSLGMLSFSSTTNYSYVRIPNLTSLDGSVVANAAFVSPTTGGIISPYVTDLTHLILDVNGYFAP